MSVQSRSHELVLHDCSSSAASHSVSLCRAVRQLGVEGAVDVAALLLAPADQVQGRLLADVETLLLQGAAAVQRNHEALPGDADLVADAVLGVAHLHLEAVVVAVCR